METIEVTKENKTIPNLHIESRNLATQGKNTKVTNNRSHDNKKTSNNNTGSNNRQTDSHPARSNGPAKDRSDEIWIVGDSILKHPKSHKMSSNTQSFKVSTHPGCTKRDMMDHIKPVPRLNPKNVAVHVGTNSLRTDESAQSCANEIGKLAAMVNTQTTKVAISSLTTRTDDANLGTTKNKWGFINHSDIDAKLLTASGKFYLLKSTTIKTVFSQYMV